MFFYRMEKSYGQHLQALVNAVQANVPGLITITAGLLIVVVIVIFYGIVKEKILYVFTAAIHEFFQSVYASVTCMKFNIGYNINVDIIDSQDNDMEKSGLAIKKQNI